MRGKKKIRTWADFPDDFVKWKLNPTGAKLNSKELAPGVFALLCSIPGVDNVGFVVGNKAVLVIDAHISIPMARQIQERVGEVTDKPILYLVNSNYHADHTFGNCAFPEETLIVQHQETAARVPYLKEEMEFMLPCVGGDPSIFDGVKLRLPDIVFDNYLRFDLGGQIVELYWFGAANTPGDTITYVPDARIAWVGNLTTGSFGLALESDAPTYLSTLARMTATLDLDTLVPAHAPIHGPEVLWANLRYFSSLTHYVRKALREGWTLKETMQRTSLDETFRLPDYDPRAEFTQGRHSFNVRQTYQSLKGS